MSAAPVVDLTTIAHVALCRILETGDVLGRDGSGRTLIAVTVEDWMFDWLMSFEAEAEDLEQENDCG